MEITQLGAAGPKTAACPTIFWTRLSYCGCSFVAVSYFDIFDQLNNTTRSRTGIEMGQIDASVLRSVLADVITSSCKRELQELPI